ncbi:MAG: hypothetical protein V3V67_06675 [Myxococcota bacterium]
MQEQIEPEEVEDYELEDREGSPVCLSPRGSLVARRPEGAGGLAAALWLLSLVPPLERELP